MDTQFPHTAREPAASHSFQVYPHLVCGPSGSREVKACRRSGKPGSSCHSRRAFSPFLELHRDSTSASPSFPSSNMAPRRGRQSPSLTYSQPPAGAHMGGCAHLPSADLHASSFVGAMCTRGASGWSPEATSAVGRSSGSDPGRSCFRQ